MSVVRPELLAHLWTTYEGTRDGRAKNGDVELLAEAAERIEWPGAPEIGPQIAHLLRAAYVKPKEGEGATCTRTRDREIIALAEIHRGEGIAHGESAKRIAEIYGMAPAAVVKVIQRKRVDK